YRPRLVRYCATQTRPERVDDAVQQTFMNAWLALRRGAEVRELRPWLYSVARNASVDQLRLARAELVEISSELAGGLDPAAVAAARDEVGDVLRAVSELPERQRTALLETAVHGKSTDLVAGEMGLSGGALRQLVHRARTSVRGMVASFFPGPLATWFAQAGGEEGTRRIALLIGGAGQGATAAALAATATVASVGAIGTAGIASLGGVASETRQAAAGAQARAGNQANGRSAPKATPDTAAVQLASLVRIPLTGELAPPTQKAEDGDGDESEASPRPRSADGREPGADERDRDRGGGDRDDRWMDDTEATDRAGGGDRRRADSDSDWSPRALASSGDGRERRRGGGRGSGWDRDRDDDGWRDDQGDASAPPEAANEPVVTITPQDPPPSPAAEPAPRPSEPEVNQPAPADTSTGGGDVAANSGGGAASDADGA
ncbi:MAG: sigma-70 family RNA polymerase sigma factor, partial [Solirubrobacteraceae bacterium]|nr:sigma-70 family RNA polymerase sigma factor [Solirubrobacteraceae bacterium]